MQGEVAVHVVILCNDNHLELNIKKINEIVVEYKALNMDDGVQKLMFKTAENIHTISTVCVKLSQLAYHFFQSSIIKISVTGHSNLDL